MDKEQSKDDPPTRETVHDSVTGLVDIIRDKPNRTQEATLQYSNGATKITYWKHCIKRPDSPVSPNHQKTLDYYTKLFSKNT